MTHAIDPREILPTVKIKCQPTKGNPLGIVEINASEYDESKHGPKLGVNNENAGQSQLDFSRTSAANADKPTAAKVSAVLPETVDVGTDQPMANGFISGKAHSKSGLSIDDWNALPDEQREKLIATELTGIRTANNYKPATGGSPFAAK